MHALKKVQVGKKKIKIPFKLKSSLSDDVSYCSNTLHDRRWMMLQQSQKRSSRASSAYQKMFPQQEESALSLPIERSVESSLVHSSGEQPDT